VVKGPEKWAGEQGGLADFKPYRPSKLWTTTALIYSAQIIYFAIESLLVVAAVAAAAAAAAAAGANTGVINKGGDTALGQSTSKPWAFSRCLVGGRGSFRYSLKGLKQHTA